MIQAEGREDLGDIASAALARGLNGDADKALAAGAGMAGAADAPFAEDGHKASGAEFGRVAKDGIDFVAFGHGLKQRDGAAGDMRCGTYFGEARDDPGAVFDAADLGVGFENVFWIEGDKYIAGAQPVNAADIGRAVFGKDDFTLVRGLEFHGDAQIFFLDHG